MKGKSTPTKGEKRRGGGIPFEERRTSASLVNSRSSSRPKARKPQYRKGS